MCRVGCYTLYTLHVPGHSTQTGFQHYTLCKKFCCAHGIKCTFLLTLLPSHVNSSDCRAQSSIVRFWFAHNCNYVISDWFWFWFSFWWVIHSPPRGLSREWGVALYGAYAAGVNLDSYALKDAAVDCSYMGLPDTVVSASTLRSFQHQLKTFLFISTILYLSAL